MVPGDEKGKGWLEPVYKKLWKCGPVLMSLLGAKHYKQKRSSD